MQINPLILLAIGLAVMFFGYFFGLFEGRGQGYKKRKAEEASEIKQENVDRGTPVPPAPAVTAPAVQPPEDPGLLRLRDKGGRLLLDVDGRAVDVENVTPEQRKRLIELVTRMRPWLEGRSAPVAPPPAPAPGPVPAVSSSPSQPAIPLREPVSPVVAAAAAQKDEPPVARTMVGQIDDILQRNIAGTPLATRGIKLQDAPGGGVIVIVGLDRYSGVGDVPDPEVQAALRTAIAMWEKKFTPGA